MTSEEVLECPLLLKSSLPTLEPYHFDTHLFTLFYKHVVNKCYYWDQKIQRIRSDHFLTSMYFQYQATKGLIDTALEQSKVMRIV